MPAYRKIAKNLPFPLFLLLFLHLFFSLFYSSFSEKSGHKEVVRSALTRVSLIARLRVSDFSAVISDIIRLTFSPMPAYPPYDVILRY